MDELKPCPFCVSRAEHYSFNYRKHTVRCRHCLADCGEHDTPERAAFVWNTRPAEDALKAEIERLKKQVADREDEGYVGFVLGVDQMKKKLAEKDKEVERLKNKLKELKECIIDSRDKYMKLTEHKDFTTATISFGAYNLLNSFIEIINAPGMNVATKESEVEDE